MVDDMIEVVSKAEPILLSIVVPTSIAVVTKTLQTLGKQLLSFAIPGWAAEMVRRENFHNERLVNQSMGFGFGNFTMQSIIMNNGTDQVLAARVAENVSLIKSIPQQYMTQINSTVLEAVSGGNTRDGLAAEIQKRGDVTLNRARIIARDQVSKANASLNQIRQQNLGVVEYVWQTSLDERVRPTHRVKHGKTFRWDTPPPDTGHPGHDYLCRCVANGVIPV